MNQALAEDPQKAAVLHYVMAHNDPEYAALMSGETDDQKKNLLPTKVRPLGEQIGDMVDQAMWSDRIGLDPQEKQQKYAEMGQQVPSMAMVPGRMKRFIHHPIQT
jgi:hypothetical protein